MMKFTKRTLSVLLALLMLATALPLSVYAATLKINTQPKTSYTAYGATAKATVKASGDGLTYTWYIKNAGQTKYSKSSVTKATYSTTMNEKSSGRYLYCVVKDKKGKTVKSNTIVLRMKATITTEPKNTYVKKDETAKVTVNAKGDGLKYQWYIKNAGGTKYSKSSVTKATYSTTMNSKSNGRYVYCVITDKYGKTAKTKTVVLRQAATIVTQPKSVKVDSGKTAKVTVKAEGDGLTYQWYIKNAGGTKYSKSSITKATYSVTMSDKVDGRYAYCIVTDKYGKTDKSKTVSLKNSSSSAPLSITMQPQNTSAAPGDQVGFGIVATGGKSPYIYELQYSYGHQTKWFNDIMSGVEILKMGDIVEMVFPVNFDEDYRYRIVVTDAAGKQVISNEVMVEEEYTSSVDPLEIDKQPESTTAAPGDQVGFGISIMGGATPYTFQLKYIHDGVDEWQDMEAEVLTIGTMTELVFVVTEESLRKQYLYCIVVTDDGGEEVYSNVVYVAPNAEPLTIDWQTPDLGVNVGDDIELAVGVSGGSKPYIYQWQYCNDSTEVWQDCQENWFTGCQTDRLSMTVNEAVFSLNYHYRCIITDAEGEQVISQPIDLVELVLPFAIAIQPQNVTAQAGDQVSFSVVVEGGTQPYTYQWQYMCDEFNWQNMYGSWCPGAQTATVSFRIDESEFVYHYKYRCMITDAYGNVIFSDEVWVVEG